MNTALESADGKSLKDLRGVDLTEAINYLRGKGLIPRLVSEDGEQYALTCDYCTDRVNLSVMNGVVTHTSVG